MGREQLMSISISNNNLPLSLLSVQSLPLFLVFISCLLAYHYPSKHKHKGSDGEMRDIGFFFFAICMTQVPLVSFMSSYRSLINIQELDRS